jgi:hypothetical protein
MDNSVWKTIGEVAFYLAIAVLLALFFVKKRKQIDTAHKEHLTDKNNPKPENNENT